jgi:ubiquinone/menaquinone biosynthesis C-methylase UbiE
MTYLRRCPLGFAAMFCSAYNRDVSVSKHLGIDIAEYDARIRTFIPHYEEMLDVVAGAFPRTARTVVDIGTGTGALAERCLRQTSDAMLIGIDNDQEMLAGAKQRIRGRAEFILGNFEFAELPSCDAAIASFSLHHIAKVTAKTKFYQRVREALSPEGSLLIADCYPAADALIATGQFEAWKAHLQRTYTPQEAQNFLDAWAGEDFYVPLSTETDCLRSAGFEVEILWQKDAFAVLHGTRNTDVQR